MLELINGANKLSILVEQYQTAERALSEATLQQEVLFRMPNEYSKEIEQAKTGTGKAIRISKASKDACMKTIQQLTGNTPESLYDLLPLLTSAIEAVQRCIQQENEMKVAFEILAAADSFEEENSREKIETKMELLKKERIAAEDYARSVLRKGFSGSDILVVSESQVSSSLKI